MKSLPDAVHLSLLEVIQTEVSGAKSEDFLSEHVRRTVPAVFTAFATPLRLLRGSGVGRAALGRERAMMQQQVIVPAGLPVQASSEDGDAAAGRGAGGQISPRRSLDALGAGRHAAALPAALPPGSPSGPSFPPSAAATPTVPGYPSMVAAQGAAFAPMAWSPHATSQSLLHSGFSAHPAMQPAASSVAISQAPSTQTLMPPGMSAYTPRQQTSVAISQAPSTQTILPLGMTVQMGGSPGASVTSFSHAPSAQMLLPAGTSAQASPPAPAPGAMVSHAGPLPHNRAHYSAATPPLSANSSFPQLLVGSPSLTPSSGTPMTLSPVVPPREVDASATTLQRGDTEKDHDLDWIVWTHSDVGDWVDKLLGPGLGASFRRHKIDGPTLLGLTEAELK
eukprot:CAMPEP_0177198884 /NCGR_PEP_ID=MMETSP0367-20130122/25371_1 /TAXON_ID=447022 ORGANISM="Scrippsiella hangoei-like, Strain SHHI-4" /NCGR_SAMPLE_ID=MMETSP0367 /ASSEMBLY_ACC=CAM_ASM_000362 /LENGTH=392 /DNA_ID=CAMNT_0018647181 /DNA_START=354 /DNA_END=1528 /DNA_ORIENTATION=-